MKRAIILHCWDGDPEYCWYPYVRQQLQLLGYKVDIPFLPEVLPLLSDWLNKIHGIIQEPDDDTYLIGHSLGSVAALKYLQSLPPGQRVGGAVLVAGFVDNLNFKPLNNFFEAPLDWAKIKEHCQNFVSIASADDPYILPYHAKVLEHYLGAELVWKQNGQHFTQIGKTPYTEFPEVVAAVKKLESQNIPNAVPVFVRA